LAISTFTPHPVTLRQLQYLVAIADSRSFRAAAEACHVSQPALSAQVAQAEEALGVRMFDRDRRRVLLTRAGELLLPRLRATLVAADDVVAAAKGLEDPLQGTLRFGVIPTIAPYLLPAVSPVMRQRFPKLTPLWREDRTAALVAGVEAGELDAALVALEAPLGELRRIALGSDPFLLCLPVGHPLARGRTPVALEALQDREVLVLDEGHCLRDQALAVCNARGAREAGFRATSLGTLVQMVGAGAGVTLLPRLAGAVEVGHAPVVLRALRAPAPARTIGLVFRGGAAMEGALEKVGEAVRKAVAKVMRARG
jgi:LysR family hydrogen peroxide-inducible transcriptional activator